MRDARVAADKHERLHLAQPFYRELEADREKQKHHPDLSQHFDAMEIGNEPKPEWADCHSREH